RAYAIDLLRWFRFLWAVDVAWGRATRVEARDFCRGLTMGRMAANRLQSVSAGNRVGAAAVMPVAMLPGFTATARSPRRPYSTSMACVNASMPPLLAAYAAR